MVCHLTTPYNSRCYLVPGLLEVAATFWLMMEMFSLALSDTVAVSHRWPLRAQNEARAY